jgi:N-methylhydantoinase B
MDAITIQVLRNKVESLVEEMHYHFYRSGYSTIIRESRDFSCVILDRSGRLIVAPPVPHARYIATVGRILEIYGEAQRVRHPGRRRVRFEPPLRGVCFTSRHILSHRSFRGEIVVFRLHCPKVRVGGTVPGLPPPMPRKYSRAPVASAVRSRSRAVPDIERLIVSNSHSPSWCAAICAQIAIPGWVLLCPGAR